MEKNGNPAKNVVRHGSTANHRTPTHNAVNPFDGNEISKPSGQCEHLRTQEFQNLLEVFKMLREQKNKLDSERE